MCKVWSKKKNNKTVVKEKHYTEAALFYCNEYNAEKGVKLSFIVH